MKVMAFDFGQTFGYAVAQDHNGTAQILQANHSEPTKLEKKQAQVGPALVRWREVWGKLISEVAQPDLVVWEQPQFHRGQGGKYIHEMIGCLRLTCEIQTIPYCAVGVGTLKKFATGKGNAKKPEMLAALLAEIPGFISDGGDFDDNMVDAVWAALWGLASMDPATGVATDESPV